jgi:hypothetical protein
MGSSSSSLIDGITHGQAFNKNEHTRMIMDELLNYMIKQLSVRDLLHMSKESECKKYVLFKANAIYQHFYELRVFPEKDAKGLLTFRRVEDLINPKGEQEKERQSLCLIVAYFYTRIFQIYGALALTLIDDMNAMSSSGLMSTFKKGNNMRGRTPGYYAQAPYYGRGGAIQLLEPPSSPPTFPLKHFDWIRSFLTGESQSSNGYKTRYGGTGDDKGIVNIKIEDQLLDGTKPKGKSVYGNPPISYQYATLSIWLSSSVNQWNKLEFYTLINPDEIKVKLGKLTFDNTEKEKIVVSNFENIVFNINRSTVNGKQTYFVKDDITDVSEFMANLLSKVIIYLKENIKEPKYKIYDRGNISSDRDYGDRSEYGERGYQSDYGTRGYHSNRSRSEEGITSHLKVEDMIKDLTTRRPLGHCIARALQLLKTDPLANEPGISQICSVAFAGKGTKTNRIGLPKSGEALSEHPGLFALANLFYDTIMIGSPHLVIGRNEVDGHPSSFQDYIAFMTTLAKQYSKGTTPLTQQESKELEEKGLSGIMNVRDEKACSKADEIILTQETTTEVYKIVKSMFQKQVDHAVECNRIISMLFTITIHPTTRKPTMFKLNDNLISRGFPELERINREARKILVDYYTNCEKKYMDGMKLVLDERDQKNAAAKQAEKAKVEAGQAQAKANLERDQAEKTALAQAKAALPKPSAPNPVIVQAQQRKARAIDNATRAQQKRQSIMQTHQQRRTLKLPR